jgi:hypothetical protein
MKGVADSSSLNKPNKNKFRYMHAYFFIFLFFFYFSIFIYISIFLLFIFLGLGPAQPTWAGLDPASPARSLAQASDRLGHSTHDLVSCVHGTVRR